MSDKMKIEKDGNQLKVYFFTVQNSLVEVQVQEDVRIILAYDDPSAFNEVQKLYKKTDPIHIRRRHSSEMRKMIGVVEAGPVPPQLILPPPKEKTAMDFVYGMMLISDKFVENYRDKASIKRILNKVIKEHGK